MTMTTIKTPKPRPDANQTMNPEDALLVARALLPRVAGGGTPVAAAAFPRREGTTPVAVLLWRRNGAPERYVTHILCIDEEGTASVLYGRYDLPPVKAKEDFRERAAEYEAVRFAEAPADEATTGAGSP